MFGKLSYCLALTVLLVTTAIAQTSDEDRKHKTSIDARIDPGNPIDNDGKSVTNGNGHNQILLSTPKVNGPVDKFGTIYLSFRSNAKASTGARYYHERLKKYQNVQLELRGYQKIYEEINGSHRLKEVGEIVTPAGQQVVQLEKCEYILATYDGVISKGGWVIHRSLFDKPAEVERLDQILTKAHDQKIVPPYFDNSKFLRILTNDRKKLAGQPVLIFNFMSKIDEKGEINIDRQQALRGDGTAIKTEMLAPLTFERWGRTPPTLRYQPPRPQLPKPEPKKRRIDEVIKTYDA